jgi:GNAT superfamily N-acetyltransferase
MTVRRAVPADAAALAELRFALRSETGVVAEERATFLERCAAWMAPRLAPDHPAWAAWVAVEDGKAVAQVWLQVFEKIPNPNDRTGAHAYVTNFYVRPELRNRGFGRALMTAALASLEGRGVTSTLLWATQGSRTLYERNGFGPPHPDVMERMG